MKKHKRYLITVGMIIGVITCFFICAYYNTSFEDIDLDELKLYLNGTKNGIVFCYQNTCCGCATVKKDLVKIVRKHNIKIVKFAIDTQESKELLFQYGLNQVPAIIKLNNGNVDVYKGDLTKENIERAIVTSNIKKERFDRIIEIDYNKQLDLLNTNADFFLLIGSSMCKDCQAFNTMFNEYINDKPGCGLYYIDCDKVKNECTNIQYETFLEEYAVEWLPCIVHIKNGVRLTDYEYPQIQFRNDENLTSPNCAAASDFLQWFTQELK